MLNKPVNQIVNVTFYKLSGKYYTSGTAVVNHFEFEDGYKQDIVNSQNAINEGWQGNYYVVVNADDDAVGFHDRLYKPEDFIGIHKQS